ncbi:hypothetical protein [Kitasatospora paranensis]|uniref:Gram-positive cocci surface proteins LPxTG domain-containing protein n=1 Tax=Kitasatospora paranensis TaxID=258053 RepID=A0ABW2G2F7_9ACTN
MTRRSLTLALAISLCSVVGAGAAHADGCPAAGPGTYRIDGVTGTVPKVRMGGSLTIDNRMHLDAPDQSAAAFETMVVPVRQTGGYTPGRAPSVSLSVDGGPSHHFSFTWRPGGQGGNLGTWISNRVQFGSISRGDHVLHETLSMPPGSPDDLYELGAYAYMDGPCGMVTGTRMGSVTYEFTGGAPAHTPTPAAPTRAGASDTPSPRTAATGTPQPVTSVNASSGPSALSGVPSPGVSGTPAGSPAPSESESDSPAAVPLSATPVANGGSALPWGLGALAASAALSIGGAVALRRRRATGGG